MGPARIGIQGHAPTVKIARAGEMSDEVGCPYPPAPGAVLAPNVLCAGRVVIHARKVGHEISIIDYGKQRQCPVCQRWFKLAYRVQVYGVKEGGQ